LSVREQCNLLDINRSTLYYTAHPRIYHSAEFREAVMARLDYWNTEQPAWGVKKLTPLLRSEGLEVSRELVRELQTEMGICTIYPHKNLSKADKNARKVPYLLRSLRDRGMIWLPNLVWAIDITYIKMSRTHLYLTAIIDWFSRFVVGWELADTLETAPVLECAKSAFTRFGEPAYLNSDQGSQFTSDEYRNLLASRDVAQSMDGKARWADNVVIERWFRTLKVENIYINEYNSPRELRSGLAKFVETYNRIRPHQGLGNSTPARVYEGCFR
jgi:putative transposase